MHFLYVCGFSLVDRPFALLRREAGEAGLVFAFAVHRIGFAAEHNFEWNFLLDGETTVVESTGNGSFPVEAEIAAMQDMYIKVQEVRASVCP